MLSFYGLLFFLFSTSVVAVPIGTGSRAATPDILMPADNAANGYWVLKQPRNKKDENYSSAIVLKIVKKKFSVFELDKDFKIIRGSEHVVPGDMKQYLAGVWQEVPLHNSPGERRFRELTIEQDPEKITLKFPLTTTASELQVGLPVLLGSYSLSMTLTPDVLYGDWVLGDATKAVPVENWREILHFESGKFSTFELDDKFNIIKRKNVDKPSPGDYFRIPFKRMKYFHRFAMLRVRETGQIVVKYLDTNSETDSEQGSETGSVLS